MADEEVAIGACIVAPSDATDAKTCERTQLRVLPPAANWYCSQVCDWGYDARNARWLILFGAKNGMCIYEFNSTDPPSTKQPSSAYPLDQTLRRPLRTAFVALLSRGKKDGRVTALQCFCDSDGELRVVCAGEEGAVQIWDPVLMTRVDQHRKHNNTELTAVSVRSELDPNWIVAGDRLGVVSLWQRDTTIVHTFSPLPRDAVFAMDLSPYDKRLVAVGYRSGALCVVDMIEKHVRFRLDGHELEVQSVVWAPSFAASGSTIDYLATASRDRSIKVWAVPRQDASTDRVNEPSLSARLEIRKPQQASSHNQSTRLWLPLAWTYELERGCNYGLWTGSFEGNLQLFQWKGAPNGTIKPSTIVKNGHNRLLFGIASLRTSSFALTGDKSEAPSPSWIATISLDRDMRIWSENLGEKAASVMTCIERIPAQGGFTYSLDFNTTRNLLACGVGDQTIRVWNLAAKQSAGGYQSELIWKGLQSKVTCVRWHPLEEHVLAFGTDDGRVGLWDSRSKNVQRLKVKHSGEIHELQWTVTTEHTETPLDKSSFQEAMKALEQAQSMGASLEDAMAQQEGRRSSSDVVVALWSGDRAGQLHRTDVDKDISIQVRGDCSAFAWDASASMLAVGQSSGKIDIMTTSFGDAASTRKKENGLVSHSSIVEHKESVSALAWRNTDTSCLLASGTKDGELIAYEGVGTSHYRRRLSQLPGYGENVVAIFKAHSGSVNCLRWSPKAETWLVASCGDDGTVNVWDVAGRVLRSSFPLHVNRVFSVSWITPTVISSSGQDQTIRIWNYEDHPANSNDKTQFHISRPSTPSTKRQQPIEPATQQEASEVGESATTKPSTKARGKKRTAKGGSLFSTSCVAWMLPQTTDANTATNPKVLRAATREGLESERKRLQQDGKIDEVAQLYLLEGRIADALRLLATHSLLTPTWVSYAPMAGPEVWREISVLYAAHLKASGDYRGAALQYLAVSQIEPAIESFADGEMFPEALTLITTRLGSSHPLLGTITQQYAMKLEKKKKIDEAASVYLSTGSSGGRMRAITILGSSGNIEDARRAVRIWSGVFKAGSLEGEDGQVIASSVFTSICDCALTQGDFELASEAVSAMLRNIESSTKASPSPQRALYTLSLITLDIASMLYSGEAGADSSPFGQSHETTIQDALHFIEALQRPQTVSWNCLLDPKDPVAERTSESGRLWFNALAACRDKGLWFEGSVLAPDEVVEQLGDAKLFDFLVSLSQSKTLKPESEATKIRELLSTSRLILKLLAELMSGYLLSALEALRDLLSVLGSSQGSQLSIMQQLVPNGLLDPTSPPLFGELADEEVDTRGLWAECCLLQCGIVFQHHSNTPLGRSEASIERLTEYLTNLIKLPQLPDVMRSKAQDLVHKIDAVPQTASDSSPSEEELSTESRRADTLENEQSTQK